MTKALISLAYYLPQFHEIPENNLWWGKGFTEWQQLKDALEYWPHQHIRKPIAPLGEYNLLDVQVMAQQNQLAKAHGISGFIVFDYWFGAGKTLLSQPIQQVLDQNVGFDYCLCWANHTWYNKRDNIMLQEQQYLGESDYVAYFEKLLPHFKSEHYIKIEHKPVFAIFNPKEVPDLSVFIATFNRLSVQHGLDGIYWIAENTDASSTEAKFFDRYIRSNVMFKARKKTNYWSYLKEKLTRNFGFNQLGPFKYDFKKMMRFKGLDQVDTKSIPVVFTGWDTTPRHLKRGTVLTGFDVEAFAQHLHAVKARLLKINNPQPITIIKSWNEWAEGNLIEPDNVFGDSLLHAYHDFVIDYQKCLK
jgi:hypothetical protein